MTKKHFTSDLHFGHENIIKYCKRPWKSAADMDEALIANWNNVVADDDEVYILGDLFFCNEKKASEHLARLKGKKFFLPGNHDKMLRKSKVMLDKFDKILPDLHEESIDGIHVVMCHYPLLTWNRAYRGSFMLHGHSHNSIPFDKKLRRLDVGVDAQYYVPIEWDEIKRRLEKVDPTDVKDY
jgi:calcineurin-like phosphoesterase family protein